MKKLILSTVVLCTFLHMNCSTKKASVGNNSSYDKTGVSPYCQELIEKIILPNWKYDESKQVFIGEKKFWEQAIFWNQHCFMNRPKSQIETILGKPSKEWKFKDGNTGVFYSLDDNTNVPTWHIQINYNKDLLVMGFTESVTFRD